MLFKLPFVKLFQLPSPIYLAKQELEESKRKLLEANSSKEYAQAMCHYYETKIKRLNVYLDNI